MDVPVSALETVTAAASRDGRKSNLRRVLRAVAAGEADSRAELARLTGLTRPTTSSLVAELIDAGLIVEFGQGPSSGGKPPTLLAVDPAARCVIAIAVGPPRVTATLSDLSGKVIAQEAIPDEAATGARLLDEVVELAQKLRDQAPAPIAGIGVGSPGAVTRDGVVYGATNLGWDGVHLVQELNRRTGVATWAVNNADAAALAEYLSMPPNGTSLALIRLGVGVGLGLLLDGRLHGGDRAAAGEIGHLVVDPGGAECSCGNRGCLETVASVRGIVGNAARAAGGRAAELPRDMAGLRERFGDEAVEMALGDAGRHLGTVVAHLVTILDVTRIVISAEIEGDTSSLVESVNESTASLLPLGSVDGVEIRTSTLVGADLVLRGAHALVLVAALGLTQVSAP